MVAPCRCEHVRRGTRLVAYIVTSAGAPREALMRKGTDCDAADNAALIYLPSSSSAASAEEAAAAAGATAVAAAAAGASSAAYHYQTDTLPATTASRQ